MPSPSDRPRRGPTHKQLRGLAMFGGLMLGLGLLSMMRPGNLRVEPVRRGPTPVHTPPAVVRAPEEPEPVVPPVERLQRPGSRAPSAVEPEPVDPEAPVRIAFGIVDAEGRPVDGQLEVLDCPGVAFSDPTVFRAPPGRCVVRAVRQDGLLTARGEPIVLQLRPGVDRDVEIAMDAPPQGGIGVQFSLDDGAMRVQGVLPDTPADRAGLEPGDRIVAIEGEALDGLDVQGIVERMTGPEGSDVEFTVEFTTDTGTTQQRVLVPREHLES